MLVDFGLEHELEVDASAEGQVQREHRVPRLKQTFEAEVMFHLFAELLCQTLDQVLLTHTHSVRAEEHFFVPVLLQNHVLRFKPVMHGYLHTCDQIGHVAQRKQIGSFAVDLESVLLPQQFLE